MDKFKSRAIKSLRQVPLSSYMRHIPSCPVKVNFPSPPIRVASTNMISPPMAVHAKPEENMRTKKEDTGLKTTMTAHRIV